MPHLYFIRCIEYCEQDLNKFDQGARETNVLLRLYMLKTKNSDYNTLHTETPSYTFP